MVKLKWLAVAELGIILILVSFILISHNKTVPNEVQSNYHGLLSPRVYSGLLEPKSFLIMNYAPLKENIEPFIRKNNISASVYVENLRSGALAGIDERISYPPASLNKVPTAMLIMKQVEKGELSLNQMIPIKDELRSNAYGDLYKTPEKELELKVLLEAMLKESDDTAYKILREYIKEEDRGLLLAYLDYYSEDSVGSKELGEESDFGIVTPKSMYNLFSSLYLSTVLEPKDSEYVLSLLTNTSFDVKKYAMLPEDVIVAQKFGLKYDEKQK